MIQICHYLFPLLIIGLLVQMANSLPASTCRQQYDCTEFWIGPEQRAKNCRRGCVYEACLRTNYSNPKCPIGPVSTAVQGIDMACGQMPDQCSNAAQPKYILPMDNATNSNTTCITYFGQYTVRFSMKDGPGDGKDATASVCGDFGSYSASYLPAGTSLRCGSPSDPDGFQCLTGKQDQGECNWFVTLPPCIIYPASYPAPTMTHTPTSTPATITFTQSASESSTASATATTTYTSSLSLSLTGTASATASPSGTASNSLSSSASPSSTASFSSSATGTSIASGSSTPSPTGTASATASPTATPSGTASSSPSSSASLSPTASPSSSATGTATGSGSSTPSPTGTASATASPTATPSGTASSSLSPTASFSSSATGTATGSGSSTPSETSTATHTVSHTATMSSTISSSTSNILTSTLSTTATAVTSISASASATSTPSTTDSISDSQTPSTTGTSTESQMLTATLSSSGSFSSTITRTSSSTCTQSESQTPTTTISPSQSLSLSDTSTTTPSGTPSMMASDSPTATVTITATNSWSGTYSKTYSGTVSESRTSSLTSTAMTTASSTISPTSSDTESKSSTFTSSSSDTGSDTATSTLTETQSFTSSISPSASSTPTVTSCVSCTPSVSHTDSFAPTASHTHTNSFSPTLTSRMSPTISASMLQSLTATSTSTRTCTPKFTSTQTLSNSDSISPSYIRTISTSLTATPSASLTVTKSITCSCTSTATASNTKTPSRSSTESRSSSLSRTSSCTFSRSSSFTGTFSPTSTSSIGPTLTMSSSRSNSASKTLSWTRTRSLTPTVTQKMTGTLTATTSTSGVNCQLSEWTSWTNCTGCGDTILRTRSILIHPLGIGIPCHTTEERQPCEPCPSPSPPAVACVVGWADWGICSTSCGTGSRERLQVIVIEPSGGGHECPELLSEKGACDLGDCYMIPSPILPSPNPTPSPGRGVVVTEGMLYANQTATVQLDQALLPAEKIETYKVVPSYYPLDYTAAPSNSPGPSPSPSPISSSSSSPTPSPSPSPMASDSNSPSTSPSEMSSNSPSPMASESYSPNPITSDSKSPSPVASESNSPNPAPSSLPSISPTAGGDIIVGAGSWQWRRQGGKFTTHSQDDLCSIWWNLIYKTQYPNLGGNGLLFDINEVLGGVYYLCLQLGDGSVVQYQNPLVVAGASSVLVDGKPCDAEDAKQTVDVGSAVPMGLLGVYMYPGQQYAITATGTYCPGPDNNTIYTIPSLTDVDATTVSMPPQPAKIWITGKVRLCYWLHGGWNYIDTCLSAEGRLAVQSSTLTSEEPKDDQWWVWVIIAVLVAIAALIALCLLIKCCWPVCATDPLPEYAEETFPEEIQKSVAAPEESPDPHPESHPVQPERGDGHHHVVVGPMPGHMNTLRTINAKLSSYTISLPSPAGPRQPPPTPATASDRKPLHVTPDGSLQRIPLSTRRRGGSSGTVHNPPGSMQSIVLSHNANPLETFSSPSARTYLSPKFWPNVGIPSAPITVDLAPRNPSDTYGHSLQDTDKSTLAADNSQSQRPPNIQNTSEQPEV